MSNTKSARTALAGIFCALVILLQLLSYTVKIGTFNLSLVLVPVVLSAALYGPSMGALTGAVFGAVTFAAAVFGLDGGGYILFSANPFFLAFLCLFKGTAAGFAAAVVARAFKKFPTFSVVAAAIAAPLVNTGSFCILMALLYKNILFEWAGGSNVIYYVIFSLVGVNFLIELALNIILSPAINRIIRALSRRK